MPFPNSVSGSAVFRNRTVIEWGNLNRQMLDNSFRQSILKTEEVLHLTVQAVGPDRGTANDVYKLNIDADLVALIFQTASLRLPAGTNATDTVVPGYAGLSLLNG